MGKIPCDKHFNKTVNAMTFLDIKFEDDVYVSIIFESQLKLNFPKVCVTQISCKYEKQISNFLGFCAKLCKFD